MKNLWKAVIIFVVCVTMVWSTSSPVLAEGITTTYTVNGKAYTVTTSDSGNVRTVNVKSDEGASKVILDKKTNIVKVTEFDMQGKIILNQSVNVPATVTLLSNKIPVVSAPASTLIARGSEFVWGHSYYVYKMSATWYYWYLYTKSGNKARTETPSNTGDLHSFKSDIDSAASNEVQAAGTIGSGLLIAVGTAVVALASVTVTAIIGLIIALGAGLIAVAGAVLAAPYIYSAWIECKDANYHYARV